MKNIPVRQIKAPTGQRTELGSFTIRRVEDILNGNDLVHDLHRHDFFFILAVAKGEGRHEIDFVNYPVGNNAVFILRPGQVHLLELKAVSTGYLIEFDLIFYQPKEIVSNQRLKRATGKNACSVESARFNRLLLLLETSFKEYTVREEGYWDVIKASLDVFFIEFIRQSKSPQQSVEDGNDYIQERFEEFMEFIETRIAEIKSVSQYAGLLNLSVYQLNAITKTVVGKTASDLINEQITLEAKRQLLATSNQVKDIADNLGYEDVSYFIRFFKKSTGHSPEAFRKNFR